MGLPPPGNKPASTVRELAAVAVAFAAATAVLTFPQVTTLGTHVGQHYDALFSVWRLSWLAHQLLRDPGNLFDANIFYPEPLTLAYSDALLFQGAVAAPLQWLGMKPVLVHNSLVLATFVASGVAMFWLVRELTRSPLAGFVAGMVFAFQPYRFGHYTQLEVLSGWWIPLAFWLFERAMASGSVLHWSLLGVAVALQTWSSIYYGVFLVSALVILTAARMPGGKPLKFAALGKAMVIGSLVTGVLVAPYLMPYLDTREIVGQRSVAEVTAWSPELSTYLVTTRDNWLYGNLLGHRAHPEGILFPGVTACVLALIGALPPMNRRRSAYVLLLVVSFDMSLGFNGFTYPLLYATALPFQGLRVPARLFIVVSAALSLLAGYGLARVLERCRTPFHKRLLAGLAAALIALESATMPLALQTVPEPSSIYRWLSRQPPSVVLEWPFPRSNALGFTFDPTFMYFSIGHWQRLVNGYSGFHPASYVKLLDTLNPFPNPAGITALRALGVNYVILHRDLAPDQWDIVNLALRESPGVRLVMTEGPSKDAVAVAVYEVVAAGSRE